MLIQITFILKRLPIDKIDDDIDFIYNSKYFLSLYMTLAQLSYIVAVDNFRNFVLAANNCFVTQPTLSMQIQKLEEELGVIIFNRSKQPVTPTEIGARIIRQAKIILLESDRLESLIESKTGEYKGSFRLGVIPTISPFLIPLFIKSFVNKYPDLELIIKELTTNEIIRSINKDYLDAGILALPVSDPGLMSLHLYYEPFYVYMPFKHKLANKKHIDESDISAKELLLLNDGHCLRGQALKLCQSSEREWNGSTRKILFESGNLDTLIKLVQNDFGITLLPYLTVKERILDDGHALVKAFKHPAPRREVGIIYSKAYLKRPLINALSKVIISSLPKELLKFKNENIIE